MIRKRLKKVLCLVLAIVAVFSLSAPAYAYGGKSAAACSCSQLKNNLICSILSHENVLTKSILRTQFKTAAAAGAAVGCTTAASLLNHSLQNSPADLNFGSSSKYAVQIMRSAECRQIVNTFKQKAAASGNTTYTMSGKTIGLHSTPDLYLAYNQVHYEASGTKCGNNWNITITFTDTYDFNMLSWEDVLTDGPLVVALCNYAAYAQAIHAITPYQITVTVKTSVSA